MFSAHSIPVDHKDLVHDVAYDFYGRRFATCSSDQVVKIWDTNEDGEWFCSSSFKAHSGSVWRVTWAHPEFGQIVATCSFDRTVAIWEEKLDAGGPPTSPSPGPGGRGTTNSPVAGTGGRNQSHNMSFERSLSSSEPKSVGSTWIRRALLVDSRTSITDVKFAPRHLGLLLATCSVDGTLRIYEAPDVMNLSQWNSQHDINCRVSCSCLSWNPCPFHTPMIAIGSDEPAHPSTVSHAPTHALASSAAQLPAPNSSIASSLFGRVNPRNVVSSPLPTSTMTHHHQPTRKLSGFLGRIQIYEASESTRKWVRIEVVPFITDPVYDIAFASSVGKDYHLFAVASSDLKILAMKESRLGTGADMDQLHAEGRGEEEGDADVDGQSLISNSAPSLHNRHHPNMGQTSTPGPRYDMKTLATFDDHRSKVWRLSWNMTGTILGSSGEDGCIRLWKSNYLDHWKGIGIIRMEGPQRQQTSGTSSSNPPSSSHPPYARVTA